MSFQVVMRCIYGKISGVSRYWDGNKSIARMQGCRGKSVGEGSEGDPCHQLDIFRSTAPPLSPPGVACCQPVGVMVINRTECGEKELDRFTHVKIA